MNMYLRSKTFEKTPNLCTIDDPWYHTKYGKEPFSEKLLKCMIKPDVSVTQKVKGKKLDLPPPNNLLPKSLDLLPKI